MAMRVKVQKFASNMPSRCAKFAKKDFKMVRIRDAERRHERSLDDVRSKSVEEILSKDFERHLPGLRYLADR